MSAAAEIGSGALTRLATRVAEERDPGRRIETLVLGIAEAVKATSNDQNVQRLARELRALAPDFALREADRAG